jgi:hypothetical protein
LICQGKKGFVRAKDPRILSKRRKRHVENETTNFYVLQDETGDPAAMVMNGRKLNQFQFLEEACRAAHVQSNHFEHSVRSYPNGP